MTNRAPHLHTTYITSIHSHNHTQNSLPNPVMSSIALFAQLEMIQMRAKEKEKKGDHRVSHLYIGQPNGYEPSHSWDVFLSPGSVSFQILNNTFFHLLLFTTKTALHHSSSKTQTRTYSFHSGQKHNNQTANNY